MVISQLKEVKQLRKVKMNRCRHLSPSLIAAICEGLCSSNSVEQVEVTSPFVSVLFVCLTTPYKALSSVSKLLLKPSTFVSLHLTGDSPFLSLGGAFHDAVQLTVLFIQFFFAVSSSHLYSVVFFVVS